MGFSPNDSVLYIPVIIVILFVVSQSIYFIVKSWKRGKELGLSEEKMKKIMISSAVFTIAPAISILLGVIALSKFLGFPLPWLRLSVIGAITYEFAAATTAASTVGISITETISDPQVYSTIAWVMTLGSIPTLFWVAIFGKKIQSGVVKVKSKDGEWGKIFMDALFLGMISAFLGMVFATINQGLVGWIPVFVMIVSAMIMAVCGFFVKVKKVKWMEDYALPISMLGAMALSIPIHNLVMSIVGG